MKNIILLSDGTGNSSAKLFRTNVWRIYEALDLRPGAGQVAMYDDGVGTASFRPLALLGGAFGLGLKRNLLDLYVFLCKTYEPGDRIYAFGFSRGAFTIRLLLGLVHMEGVIVGQHGQELERLARWAYRGYRCHFNQTGGLVWLLRRLRDRVFRMFERIRGKSRYDTAHNERPDIHFVGLWDTVSAYGLPAQELTDAWDRWIWPLTFRTNVPNPKIRRGCHALSLDDERQTFHPLLWDERGEPRSQKSTRLEDERISQVWFAGVHSNLGGGYADDGMSYESLAWIADEARRLDLVFRPVPFFPGGDVVRAWKALAVSNTRIYDSRSGLAGYYRYCPRNIQKLPGDRTDADVIPSPKIHESVFDRRRLAAADYNPIVIPPRYRVARYSGDIQDQNTYGVETEDQADVRFDGQQSAWNLVWVRRVVYFATVLATLWLLALPFVQPGWMGGILLWALPSVGKVVGLLSALLPGVFGRWTDHFQRFPMQLVVFGGLVAALLFLGASLRQSIEDRMFDMWRSAAPVPRSWLGQMVLAFRTAKSYLGFARFVRYAVVPNVVGVFILLMLALIGTAAVTLATFDVAALGGNVCRDVAPPFEMQPDEPWVIFFDHRELCYATGLQLHKGGTYQITLTLPGKADGDPPEGAFIEGRDSGRWMDRGHIVESVKGFETNSVAFALGLPFRRHFGLRWFVPVARVGSTGAEFYALDDVPVIAVSESQSVSTIRPRVEGQLFLYVNDALPPCRSWTCLYDNNNGGAATVTVTRR